MFLNHEIDRSIFPISPRDAVRKRPGMYVGGTDSNALHHLIYQVMDHLVEEAFVGRCTHISLTLFDNAVVSIFGEGEGLPVDRYRDTSLTKLEALMQGIDVSKRDFEPNVYQITGGLHGLGLAVINMLCAEMIVENNRDGFLCRQIYREGLPQTALERLDGSTQLQGTKFTFKPDFTIFQAVPFDRDRLIKRCREIAYQIAHLKVTLADQRDGTQYEETFFAGDGLRSMIVDMNVGPQPLHDPICGRREVAIPREGAKDLLVGIEFAFQFTTGEQSHLFSYANTVQTPDGGTHLAALKASILSVLNQYIEIGYDWDGPDDALSWQDITPGLSAAIAIRLSEPKFESPTKVRLGNDEIYGPISGLVFEVFHPQYAVIRRIIEHHLTRKVRE